MKILKHLEEDLAKIDTDQLAPTIGQPAPTPTQILEILASFKGVIITVLSFVKFFTSDEADVKIDALITWLGQLPLTPKP